MRPVWLANGTRGKRVPGKGRVRNKSLATESADEPADYFDQLFWTAGDGRVVRIGFALQGDREFPRGAGMNRAAVEYEPAQALPDGAQTLPPQGLQSADGLRHLRRHGVGWKCCQRSRRGIGDA